MSARDVEHVLRIAKQNGDLLLQAACWQTLLGFVPYRLWAQLSSEQRSAVPRSCGELSRRLASRSRDEPSRLSRASVGAVSDLGTQISSPGADLELEVDVEIDVDIDIEIDAEADEPEIGNPAPTPVEPSAPGPSRGTGGIARWILGLARKIWTR